MKQPQPPEFLGNVYRDMRDRRLLPVAAALLLAIVAAPVVLKADSSPPIKAEVASSGAAALGPRLGAAVAVSDHGVRKVNRRLGGRGEANPFSQKFRGVDNSGSTLQATGAASGSGGGGTVEPSKGSSGGSGGNSASNELVLVDYKVDVKTGQVGSSLADRTGVKELTYLPGTSKPIFVFMGVTTNGKNALFLLPGGLSLTGGSCLVPIGGNCSVVTMKVGKTIDVIWTDLKTYRLKLEAIHPVVHRIG